MTSKRRKDIMTVLEILIVGTGSSTLTEAMAKAKADSEIASYLESNGETVMTIESFIANGDIKAEAVERQTREAFAAAKAKRDARRAARKAA